MYQQAQTYNKTKYQTDTSRKYNTYLRTNTHKYKLSKRKEYLQRLHFDYEYTKNHGGKAFAWTLTYNDLHMPTFMGYNVHDFKDVRNFFRNLQTYFGRHFNIQVKYCVFEELGEGKGSRGFRNNPHYHTYASFVSRENLPITLDEKTIFQFAQYFWQGGELTKRNDNSVIRTNNTDYATSMHGAIKYSTKSKSGAYGFITSERALRYATKYAVKDLFIEGRESDILKELQRQYYKELEDCYEFYHTLEVPFVNDLSLTDFTNFFTTQKITIETNEDDYDEAVKAIDSKYQKLRDDFKSRYAIKVRSSQNLGHFEQIEEKVDPTTLTYLIPNSKGALVRVPLQGYFFRKYCYRVEKQETVDTNTGELTFQNYYRPNERYVNYLVNTLSQRLIQGMNRVDKFISLINQPSYVEYFEKLVFPHTASVTNRVYFTPMFALDLEFILRDYDIDLDSFKYSYSIYKNIYCNRMCSDTTRLLAPEEDYCNFISNEYTAEYSIVHDESKTFGSTYEDHEQFRALIPIFDFVDAILDYHSYKCYKSYFVEFQFMKMLSQQLNEVFYKNYKN